MIKLHIRIPENNKQHFYWRLFFICVFVNATTIAQVKTSEQSSSSFKTNPVLDQANLMLDKNFSQAFQLALKAQEKAIAEKDTGALVESVCILSTIRINTEKAREALISIDDLTKQIARKGNSLLLGKLLSVKGSCYYNLGIYDSSRYHFENAVSVLSTSGNKSLLSRNYNLLAKALIKTGETQKALNFNEKAIALSKNCTAVEQAFSTDILGDVYVAQRLLEQAGNCYRRSYEMYKSTKHLRGMGAAALHTGNVYYLTVKDDSAKKYYNEALNHYLQLGDTNGTATCYSNLSRIYLETGDNKLAIEYANKALESIGNGEYSIIETATLQQLGDIYAAMNELQKAAGYVNKALVKAKNNNQKVVLKDCHKSLSEIYEAMKRPDLAFGHLLAAYRLKDSLQPISLNRQLAEMQAKYETEKKQNEINLLEKENLIKGLEIEERQAQIKKRNWIILLNIIIILLSGTAVYFINQKRKLKNRMAQEYAVRQTEENERIRMAKDIHDELGSGLSKIKFLSELASGNFSPKQQRDSLGAISETAKGLVDNMRDLIWAMNPENVTLDNLVARIREYSHDYLDDFPVELTIDISDDIPNRKITKEISRNVFMIVKESLQNIVKHASATKVEMKMDLNNGFSVKISDNGKGFDPLSEKSGNGLKNIKARSNSIGAKFEIISVLGKGSELTVEIEAA